MHKAFTLMLVVAQGLAIAAPRRASDPLAGSRTMLGCVPTPATVVYAPSKASRSTVATVVAVREPRARRTLTRTAVSARPRNAGSRRAFVHGRTPSSPRPARLVLRI